jgi:hypothetical protein
MPLYRNGHAEVFWRMPLSVTFFASVLLGQACQAPTIDDGWQAHAVGQTAPPPGPPGTGPRVPVPVLDHDILKPRIIAQLLCARAFAECIGDDERISFGSELQDREHACADQLESVISSGKHTSALVIKYGQNLQYCFGILLDLLFNLLQHNGVVAEPRADLFCFKCDGKLSHFLQTSNVLVHVPEPERVRADPPRYPGPAFPPDEEPDAEVADSRQGRLVSGPLFGLLQEIDIQKQTSMLQAYATLASMPERDFIALEAIATWAGSANGPGIPVLAQTITHADMLSMTAAEFEAWAADFGFTAVEQNPAAGIKLFSDGDVLALVVRGAVIVLVGGVLIALVVALVASGPPGWAVLAVLASAALLYQNGNDPHL